MWTLLLARLADPPGTYIDRRQVDSGQIKIGRGARVCDWVLADQDGHLSREHCTVIANGLDLFILDSSTNGVALNTPTGRIQPQLPVAIRVGDKLFLGDYRIDIANESGAAAALVAPPPPPLPMAAAPAQADEWFSKGEDPIWGSGRRDADVHEFLGNSFNDFLSPPPSSSRSTGEAFGAVGMGAAFSKPIMAPMAPMAGDFGIPEDWASVGASPKPATDPFGADPFAASKPRAPLADPFADPFAETAPPPFRDDPFAPPPADPFAPPQADPFAASSAMADPFADLAPPADPFGDLAPPADPFADPGMPAVDPFADLAPAPFGGASPAADPFADFDMPALPSATPIVAPTPAPPTPVAGPARPPASPAIADAADWAAFCDGAGMEVADLRLSADAMRRLGIFYRQVVLGLSDLIQERAEFKNEFRVERTQLGIGRNNPLKHLPALDSAKLLLGDPLPGFMAADEAVRTAFEDLKKHQMAMLAGVQAAMTAVFQRLAPAEIERLMQKAAGEKRGFALKRGVDPWTVYQTVFEALRVDATSNANSVMSVAFRDGYEAFLKSVPVGK